MSNAVLKGNASGTGTVTLETPNTNTDRTISIPDATGTVMVSGNMPAFSAYPNANTTLNTTTWTKIALQVEVFDTNNNFASSRFTPTVAGYYQLNGAISTDQPAGSALPAIYKNGVQTLKGAVVPANSSLGTNTVVSGLVYMNGSTDYVELYGYQSNGSAAQTYSNSVDTYFNGSLVRAA